MKNFSARAPAGEAAGRDCRGADFGGRVTRQGSNCSARFAPPSTKTLHEPTHTGSDWRAVSRHNGLGCCAQMWARRCLVGFCLPMLRRLRLPQCPRRQRLPLEKWGSIMPRRPPRIAQQVVAPTTTARNAGAVVYSVVHISIDAPDVYRYTPGGMYIHKELHLVSQNTAGWDLSLAFRSGRENLPDAGVEPVS